ncbi:MAG TPA: DUF1194 domain-containing protein [Thermohalobaculum sp.]|nr:DUF1194 domain-containing protein [Thermohalobaculum sp.]
MRLAAPLFCVLAILLAGPAGAEPVDLELVLLADASGSIDNDEIMFQRRGYAEAITDQAVLDAIASTGYGRIAVTYVEWGQANSQEVVVGWSLIDGPGAASDFAGALIEPPRLAFGRNAIGAALLAGKRLIGENAFEGNRRVIDFSADSANNWNGPSIAEARAEVLAEGIIINGLAVLCRDCWSGRAAEYDLEKAFQDRIVGGPGSFVVTADGPESFAAAVRRKLILEIAGAPPGGRLFAAR